jgi:hypothetical protein
MVIIIIIFANYVRIWNEADVANFHSPEGTEENHRKHVRIAYIWARRDSNRLPPEYKSRVLPLQLARPGKGSSQNFT